jgi:hypothetical protein
MTTKYIFEQYEITLILTSDNVTINILDTKLYQLYRKSYKDIHIIEYCPNINIFHTVLKTSFESLVNNDITKADVNIRTSSSHLVIHINHKFYINFIFDLQLDLDKSNTLSAKDLCIKKLESNIKSLTSNFNALKCFIDDYMEVTISDENYFINHSYGLRNASFSIKVNTPEIELLFNTNGSAFDYPTLHNKKQLCVIKCIDSTKFNENFKIINCNKLTINNYNYDFNYCNLPESLTEITIKGSSSGFIKFIKTINLTKLVQLDFIGSNDLTTIYEDIKHLKIKKIRMNSCANFRERDLLLTNGYKFEVY